MDKTDWDSYGYGRDPRCENCLVHSGFEANAATGCDARLGDTLKMAKWDLFG